VNYKINSRWAISSDKYNWILTETMTPANGKPYNKHTYYPTLKQLSNAIVDIQAKDTLARLSITEGKNTSPVKRIKLLIDKTTQDLESFLQEMAHNEKILNKSEVESLLNEVGHEQ
jgi:hypothetical protein